MPLVSLKPAGRRVLALVRKTGSKAFARKTRDHALATMLVEAGCLRSTGAPDYFPRHEGFEVAA